MAHRIEYLNPKPHAIQIASRDKKIIKIKANERIILSDWYMTYCPKYLRVVRIIEEKPLIIPKKIEPNQYIPERLHNQQGIKKQKLQQNKLANKTSKQSKIGGPIAQTPTKLTSKSNIVRRRLRERKKNPIVGRTARESGSKLFTKACQQNNYLISNNIGIGILSFNRLDSLKRLVGSIREYTDLRKTTVFVSDESTNPEVGTWLKNQTDIVVLTGQNRIGIAGNSNRLLKCLSRFKHCLLLNDDVEVLRKGWEKWYVRASKETGIHHFCYHQTGIYGAKRNGKITKFVQYKIETITDRPHGAVMFYTNELFKKIGYFDEKFGYYGIEHVDWSTRAGKSGLQMPGFHDVMGSERYFVIHKDRSAVPNRTVNLSKAREVYKTLKSLPGRLYIKHSKRIKIQSLSVVIPIRQQGRQQGRQRALETVTNAIRGQLFPYIEIIVIEQDGKKNIDLDLPRTNMTINHLPKLWHSILEYQKLAIIK